VNPATHALAGMTIGSFLRKPLLALTAGVASHALLDCLPHQDRWYPEWRILYGGLTVAILIWALNGPNRAAKFSGAVGALLPDIENIPGRTQSKSRPLFPSHWFRHEDRSGRHGIAAELVVVAMALAIHWKARNRGVIEQPLDVRSCEATSPDRR
jgi:hypothetical protein